MRIVNAEVIEPLVLDVHFEDSARLTIRFLPERLRGNQLQFLDAEEFRQAELSMGTVVGPCGVVLDAQVARIKADKGRVSRVRHEVLLFSAFSSVQPIKSMTWSSRTEIV
jgi:hypothetical protein